MASAAAAAGAGAGAVAPAARTGADPGYGLRVKQKVFTQYGAFVPPPDLEVFISAAVDDTHAQMFASELAGSLKKLTFSKVHTKETDTALDRAKNLQQWAHELATKADYVLCVCTPTYTRHTAPDSEAKILDSVLSDTDKKSRVINIVPTGAAAGDIKYALPRTDPTYYHFKQTDRVNDGKQLTGLMRHMVQFHVPTSPSSPTAKQPQDDAALRANGNFLRAVLQYGPGCDPIKAPAGAAGTGAGTSAVAPDGLVTPAAAPARTDTVTIDAKGSVGAPAAVGVGAGAAPNWDKLKNMSYREMELLLAHPSTKLLEETVHSKIYRVLYKDSVGGSVIMKVFNGDYKGHGAKALANEVAIYDKLGKDTVLGKWPLAVGRVIAYVVNGELRSDPPPAADMTSPPREVVCALFMEELDGDIFKPTMRERVRVSGPKDSLRRICFLMGATLHTLHRRNLLHCDVKPHNFLFKLSQLTANAAGQAQVEARMCDFGLCVELKDDEGKFSTIKKDTLLSILDYAYCSPELALLAEQINSQLTVATDYLSFAVSCIYVLTGLQPFKEFYFWAKNSAGQPNRLPTGREKWASYCHSAREQLQDPRLQLGATLVNLLMRLVQYDAVSRRRSDFLQLVLQFALKGADAAEHDAFKKIAESVQTTHQPTPAPATVVAAGAGASGGAA